MEPERESSGTLVERHSNYSNHLVEVASHVSGRRELMVVRGLLELFDDHVDRQEALKLDTSDTMSSRLPTPNLQKRSYTAGTFDSDRSNAPWRLATSFFQYVARESARNRLCKPWIQVASKTPCSRSRSYLDHLE
jgi:hypothetical protein